MKQVLSMYQKFIAVGAAAFLLAACSEPRNEAKPEMVCHDAGVTQNIQTNIQEIIKQEARNFAAGDSRQLVDADKVIAAASQLSINLADIRLEYQNNQPFCAATLSIQTPSAIAATAEANSPLLYGTQTITQLIQHRTNGSNLSYNAGNHTFNTPLQYTTSPSTGQLNISYRDNSLVHTAQTLSAALLPYGIKDILVISGEPVTRADALQQLTNPPASEPEPPVAVASAEVVPIPADLTAFPAEAPEILTPAKPQQEEILLSAGELDYARSNNRAANEEINAIWHRLDQPVQQSLLAEQRNWIDNKTENCRQAAARANSNVQAEYLQLQCDTRITRERSQYLRGYTIN